MEEKLLELVRKAVADDSVELTTETEFVDDMGLGSMEFYHMLSEIEAAYGVKFTDREIQELETLGDLAELVADARER